jgi:hypothetical protein
VLLLLLCGPNGAVAQVRPDFGVFVKPKNMTIIIFQVKKIAGG